MLNLFLNPLRPSPSPPPRRRKLPRLKRRTLPPLSPLPWKSLRHNRMRWNPNLNPVQLLPPSPRRRRARMSPNRKMRGQGRLLPKSQPALVGPLRPEREGSLPRRGLRKRAAVLPRRKKWMRLWKARREVERGRCTCVI